MGFRHRHEHTRTGNTFLVSNSQVGSWPQDGPPGAITGRLSRALPSTLAARPLSLKSTLSHEGTYPAEILWVVVDRRNVEKERRGSTILRFDALDWYPHTPMRWSMVRCRMRFLLSALILAITSSSVFLPQPLSALPTSGRSGTGFIVTDDGYILTNYYVVEDAISIEVRMSDGTRAPASLIAFSPTWGEGGNDIALLKIADGNLPTLPIGDSDAVALYESVIALGFPLASELGVALTATGGHVTSVRDFADTPELFQLDAAVNPGNSGGPLVDMSGRVMGIITSAYREGGAEGVNFAVPINLATELLEANAPSWTSCRESLGEIPSEQQVVANARASVVFISTTVPIELAKLFPSRAVEEELDLPVRTTWAPIRRASQCGSDLDCLWDPLVSASPDDTPPKRDLEECQVEHQFTLTNNVDWLASCRVSWSALGFGSSADASSVVDMLREHFFPAGSLALDNLVSRFCVGSPILTEWFEYGCGDGYCGSCGGSMLRSSALGNVSAVWSVWVKTDWYDLTPEERAAGCGLVYSIISPAPEITKCHGFAAWPLGDTVILLEVWRAHLDSRSSGSFTCDFRDLVDLLSAYYISVSTPSE